MNTRCPLEKCVFDLLWEVGRAGREGTTLYHRKQVVPGLRMIHCAGVDRKYYGEL